MKWITRGRQRWSKAFPECARPDCHRPAIPWIRVPVRRGIWLHGSWFCSLACFEPAVRERFAQACLPIPEPPVAQHRIPLGLLLLSRGVLTASQLRVALDAQSSQGGQPLGYWLEQLGFASEAQITAALGLQWACPVLPRLTSGSSGCSRMVPVRLQESFCMLPVQFIAHSGILHVAFSQRVEYTALYALEEILACRTQACVLGHSQMEQALGRIALDPVPGEMLFEGGRDAGEMVRITSSYLHQARARTVRVAACGNYIWVRLQGAPDISNLLFRRTPALWTRSR